MAGTFSLKPAKVRNKVDLTSIEVFIRDFKQSLIYNHLFKDTNNSILLMYLGGSTAFDFTASCNSLDIIVVTSQPLNPSISLVYYNHIPCHIIYACVISIFENWEAIKCIKTCLNHKWIIYKSKVNRQHVNQILSEIGSKKLKNLAFAYLCSNKEILENCLTDGDVTYKQAYKLLGIILKIKEGQITKANRKLLARIKDKSFITLNEQNYCMSLIQYGLDYLRGDVSCPTA